MKRHGSLTIVSAVGFALSLTSAVRGEPSPSAQRKAQADYSYAFVDDPLSAGGIDVHDARIRVASHGLRMTLIRPRTAFVAELLKTVENL